MDLDLKDIREFQAGSGEALERLMRQVGGRMLSFIRLYVRSPEIADEIFQQVWIQVWEKRKKLRNNTSFESWVYQIARSAIFNETRSRTWHSQMLLFDDAESLNQIADTMAGPQQVAEMREWQKALNEAIEEMEERLQHIIGLRFKADMKLRQIAETLNLSVSTSHYLLQEGLDLLRKNLIKRGFKRD